MTDKRWKRHERTVARRLNGRRVGPSGTSTADVVNGWLSVECKDRKSLPQWILEAIAQSVAAAATSQLAIVVLHEAGMRHDDDLVVMRLRDFKEWFDGKQSLHPDPLELEEEDRDS